MKYLITLILTLSFTFFGFSQKTKKIKLKEKGTSISEVYRVLKSVNTIKHGTYYKYYRKNKLIEGQYENNVPSGEWDYYNGKGEIIHTVKKDSLENELIYNKEEIVKEGSNSDLSRPLIILGGKYAFLQKFIPHFRYPSMAREMGIQAKLMVILTISTKGEIIKIDIKNNPGYNLGKATREMILKSNFDFLPALNENGIPIESKHIFPVNYKIKS